MTNYPKMPDERSRDSTPPIVESADDAALQMFAGATFGPDVTVVLPSGKTLGGSEMQLFSSLWETSPDEALRRPRRETAIGATVLDRVADTPEEREAKRREYERRNDYYNHTRRYNRGPRKSSPEGYEAQIGADYNEQDFLREQFLKLCDAGPTPVGAYATWLSAWMEQGGEFSINLKSLFVPGGFISPREDVSTRPPIPIPVGYGINGLKILTTRNTGQLDLTPATSGRRFRGRTEVYTILPDGKAWTNADEPDACCYADVISRLRPKAHEMVLRKQREEEQKRDAVEAAEARRQGIAEVNQIIGNVNAGGEHIDLLPEEDSGQVKG